MAGTRLVAEKVIQRTWCLFFPINVYHKFSVYPVHYTASHHNTMKQALLSSIYS